MKEDVGEGAYVQLQVKYGLIRIVTTKADLCEQVSNVDLECPIKKGVTTITKEVELPKEIPPVCPCSKTSSLRISRLIFGYRENTPSLLMLTPRRVRRLYAWRLLSSSKREMELCEMMEVEIP